MDYKIGDRVKVTITGTVKGDPDRRHNYCQRVTDGNGNNHYVFIGYGSHDGLEVEKLEDFKAGAAYQDADGDVFLRTADGRWIDFEGDNMDDEYAKRPLVRLVPAKDGE